MSLIAFQCLCIISLHPAAPCCFLFYTCFPRKNLAQRWDHGPIYQRGVLQFMPKESDRNLVTERQKHWTPSPLPISSRGVNNCVCVDSGFNSLPKALPRKVRKWELYVTFALSDSTLVWVYPVLGVSEPVRLYRSDHTRCQGTWWDGSKITGVIFAPGKKVWSCRNGRPTECSTSDRMSPVSRV